MEGKTELWRAGRMCAYYYIADLGCDVCRSIELGQRVDNERYAAGNYFCTRAEAERCAGQIVMVFYKHKLGI